MTSSDRVLDLRTSFSRDIPRSSEPNSGLSQASGLLRKEPIDSVGFNQEEDLGPSDELLDVKTRDVGQEIQKNFQKEAEEKISREEKLDKRAARLTGGSMILSEASSIMANREKNKIEEEILKDEIFQRSTDRELISRLARVEKDNRNVDAILKSMDDLEAQAGTNISGQQSQLFLRGSDGSLVR